MVIQLGDVPGSQSEYRLRIILKGVGNRSVPATLAIRRQNPARKLFTPSCRSGMTKPTSSSIDWLEVSLKRIVPEIVMHRVVENRTALTVAIQEPGVRAAITPIPRDRDTEYARVSVMEDKASESHA